MKLISYLIFIFCLSFSFKGNSTHLIGADITYECLGGNEYEILLTVYRDCGVGVEAEFDDPARIRIHTLGTTLFADYVADLASVTDVDQVSTDPCIIIPEYLCVEKGEYYFYVTLPDSTQGFEINHQRCCFGASVNNIDMPEDKGINISATIPPVAYSPCYSSPKFVNDPLLTICLNNPNSEDFSVTSTTVAGEQYDYKFYTPFQGSFGGGVGSPTAFRPLPHIPLVWQTGYSETYPMDANPPVAIDGMSGLFTGTVNTLGQFLMGTKVEIKNAFNVKVGEINRVFKYTIADCSAGEHKVPIITDIGNQIQVCQGESHTFQLGSNSTTDSVHWAVNGNIIGYNSEETHTFNNEGVFPVEVYGYADTSECYVDGSDQASVRVFNYTPTYNVTDSILCIDQETQFVDFTSLPSDIIYSITGWYWEFGDGNSSTVQNPIHSYSNSGLYDITLTVTLDNGCSKSFQKENHIEVYDVNIDFNSITSICVDNEVPFTSVVNMPAHVNNPPVLFEWSFGDGGTSTEEHPAHLFSEIGEFDVELTVTLQNGCNYYISYADYMEIYDDYIDIDLTYSHDTIAYPFADWIIVNPTTTNYDSLVWYLNGERYINNPNFSYSIPEDYDEDYLAIKTEIFEGSCAIELEKFITITYADKLFVPNAFSPNGDLSNPIFMPVGRTLKHASFYEFAVYNRYGEEYFITNDPEEGWYGTDKNGNEVESGMFVWKLKLQTTNSGNYDKQGVVMLIK
ncbi:MAG: PKD domain-containing protein [Flavobacteriales bacterium]